MKIVVYGDDSIASGGWFYKRALERLGNCVSCFNDWNGLTKYSTNFLCKMLRRLNGQILSSDQKLHWRLFEKHVLAFRPDLIIVLKGLHLTSANVLHLRSLGAFVVNLNHDDFFSSYSLNRSRWQISALSQYDFVFATRMVNVNEIKVYNPNVEFFPFSFDREIHSVVVPSDQEISEWTSDVVFIGTFAPHRALMLERLVQRVPANYSIYGGGWEKLSRGSPLRRYVVFRQVRMRDLSLATGLSKISLGFLRKENRDQYTQRSFEIPACGGCLLAERTSFHSSIYQEGQEAEFFESDSLDELESKVVKLLADTDYRERIRQNGIERIQSIPYTYDDRVFQILEKIRN